MLMVKTTRSREGRLAFVGETLPCGCYVLRFDLCARLEIPCGQFEGGKSIVFEPGSYAYIGSAMARKGAFCLAGRLTRHAARLYGGNPHPILKLMLSHFPAHGLGEAKPDRKGIVAKNPKWNVDWPLNQPCASLKAVYAIRSLWRVEGFVAKFLERDPATLVFERHLGAADISGNTHMLRVDAGEAWWHQLPAKLAEFLPRAERMASLSLRLGSKVVKPAVAVGLTDRQLDYLRGRWHSRAAMMMKLMARGRSFEVAKKGTEHIYDTAHSRKIPSRLSRGRGSVLKALSNLRKETDSLAMTKAQRGRIVELGGELKRSAGVLRETVAAVAGRLPRLPLAPLPRASSKALKSFKGVEGMLTGCLRFLRKNIHDVPLLEKRTGSRLTEAQIRRVAQELVWIEAAAKQLIEVCRRTTICDCEAQSGSLGCKP